MNQTPEQELHAAITDWDRAMVDNDPDRIGLYMADDWRIIGPDGTVTDRDAFLGLVRSGMLTHDQMASGDLEIRIHGDDAATTIARGTSGGLMDGYRFLVVERVSCTYVRADDGRWRCVLTHLSRLDGPGDNGA